MPRIMKLAAFVISAVLWEATISGSAIVSDVRRQCSPVKTPRAFGHASTDLPYVSSVKEL